MIRLTRLNQVPLVLNSDLIEHMELTPDTMIALTTGQKFMVRETPEEVIERVIEFRRAVLSRMPAYAWPPREQALSATSPTSLRLVKDDE